MMAHDRAAPRIDRTPRRRPLRLRACPAPGRSGADRRGRRGGPRRLCGPPGRGGGDPAGGQGRHRARARRLQAAHRQGARALLRAGAAPRAGLVGGGHRAGGVRPARHARRQRRGAAPVAGPAGPPAGVRAHRRVPRRRPRGAGPGHVEGRPGRCVHLGRLGDREGDPRPDHVRAARAVPGVRLRPAQGLLHPRARRGAGRARSEPGAPDAVRQRAACRWDHRPGTHQSGAPAGAVGPDRRQTDHDLQEVLR